MKVNCDILGVSCFVIFVIYHGCLILCKGSSNLSMILLLFLCKDSDYPSIGSSKIMLSCFLEAVSKGKF